MATKDDVTKLDLYELFGVKVDATEKEIKTAYRKKALTCHPDKNPDNPNAAKLFHQLLKALEILTDGSAKAAYDKVLKARKAAHVRNQLLDSKRKKLKEELESREKDAEFEKTSSIDAELKLQREIDRLRKEGSKQVEQEVELLKQQIKKEKELLSQEPSSNELPRLKVQWQKPENQSADPYNEESLTELFKKYGEITGLIKSKKRRAVIEFASLEAAESAFRCEVGLPKAPIEISWLTKPPAAAAKPNHPAQTFQTDPYNKGCSDDYESLVLRKMRQAEERKRLTEQLQKEEVEDP